MVKTGKPLNTIYDYFLAIMDKPKKRNTQEAVQERISNLEATLQSVSEIFESEKRDYSLAPETIIKNIVDFLSQHEVDVMLPYLGANQYLGVNTQPKLDLAERTYRLVEKIILKNYEDRNPRPIVAFVLNVFSPVLYNSNIISLMDTFSDTISVDYNSHRLMPTTISVLFPQIVQGFNEALEPVIRNIKRKDAVEKMTQEFQTIYQDNLQTFLETVYTLSEQAALNPLSEAELQELGLTESEKLHGDIEKAKSQSFNYDRNNAVINYSIESSEVSQLARIPNGLAKFEQRHGAVVGIQYSKGKRIEQRSMIIHTQNSSGDRRITVTFPGYVTSMISDFFQDTMFASAQNNNFGNNVTHKARSIQAHIYLQRGYLIQR